MITLFEHGRFDPPIPVFSGDTIRHGLGIVPGVDTPVTLTNRRRLTTWARFDIDGCGEAYAVGDDGLIEALMKLNVGSKA